MTDAFTVSSAAQAAPTPITLRCPVCHHLSRLDTVAQHDQRIGGAPTYPTAGIRACANPECRTLIFVVYRGVAGRPQVLAAHPAETLDYDASNLPEKVLSAFEEAIKCHAARCYRASTIMVRRTLEEVCADQGATGGTLADRLRSLSGKTVLPPDLIDLLDGLRLLGNDAAHVELKTFDQIAEPEAALAIQATKEILKALYQLSDLLTRMKARQKPSS